MEIDSKLMDAALRKILEVEHSHLYGAKTGSDTARRREVEKALGRVMDELMRATSSSEQ